MTRQPSAPSDRWGARLRALAVAACGLAAAALLSQTALYPRMTWWLDDALQRRVARVVPMDHVVVVDVDEASMQRLEPSIGAWPYPRDVYAILHRFLVAHAVRAVAYDILFSEARAGDDAFGAALDARGVLAVAALPYSGVRGDAYHDQLAHVALGDAGPGSTAHPWSDLTLPLPTLTRANGARVGVFSTIPDDDGIVRHVTPLHQAYGKVLPGFTLAALLAARPGDTVQADSRALRVGTHAWPLADDGSISPLLPANLDELTVLPFYQVLAAARGAPGTAHIGDIVRDRIVFVGSSTAVLGDFVLTRAGRLPGLMANALVAESLLADEVLSPERTWLNALLALAALVWPCWLAARGALARPRDFALAVSATLVALVGVVVALALARQQAAWLFAAAASIAAFGAALSVWLLALYQERQRLFYEKAAAQEAARLKTEFLNQMTHELRTPVTAIMGFNKFNLYGDEIGREQRLRHSAIIARNCEHLLALVNNNLDLARMEAGQFKLEPMAQDPRALFDDVLATLRLLAHDKGLALESEIAADLPQTLSLDAFRVRQVLINLLGNAVKFTARGKVTLAARWRDGELDCEVRDTGPGIPPDSLERIFEPFERVPGVTAAGTGLGLSITRKLVQLMGGTLRARSQVGEGSVFEARIPAPLATPEAPAAAAPAPARVASPKLAGRVLVADDNADLRELVQMQLAELGFTCRTVGDGLEAIEAALAEPYTVVLLDMDMPFMDGYETVRVLRERGYKGTVVGFTAHQAGAALERALIEGCDEVLTKPVSAERLRDALAPFAESGGAEPVLQADAIAVQVDVRLRALVKRFLGNCTHDVGRLHDAMRRGDLETARLIGHSLRGAGGSYGFDEITHLGGAIEASSIEGDASRVRGLIAQLEDYVSRVHPVYGTP